MAMSDTTVEIDVFDPIHRAATEAGIDPELAEFEVVEFTDDADLTVEIRQGEGRLDDEDARRVARKAVVEHDLSHWVAADLADRTPAWVSKLVHGKEGVPR
jgi:hypothetical protein